MGATEQSDHGARRERLDPHAVYGRLSHSYGKNHFDVDKPFQLILRYFAPTSLDLSALGAFAGAELYEVADYVDKIGRPRLLPWSIDGDRIDEVWLEPLERQVLERLSKEFAVNRPPYRGGSWFDHYAAIYLISDPGIACILTVTNQTAYALFKYGDPAQKKLIPGLIGESDPRMYGATWFTEIQGGSDQGANRVEALRRGGAWRITGDTKYFSSNAGLADYALVSARPRGSPAGAKGLGLFLVPKIDAKGQRNFTVRRLKDKSATISVPTGEIEFRDAEAEPIGDLRKGIYYLMENLMVSRLSNSFGALGIARKAFLEAYLYAQQRRAFDKVLIDHPLVQRDLLDMEVSIEGSLVLALKAVDQFAKSWKETPPYTEGYHYARLLTHVAKNLTADVAARTTQSAMELLGGIGFLQEYPVERLHREALVLPIWEGPSNIQALDLLEVIAKKNAHLPLLADMRTVRDRIVEGKDGAALAVRRMEESLTSLATASPEVAQFSAKDTLATLGHGIATVLLLAVGDQLKVPRMTLIGRLYASHLLEGKPYSGEVLREARRVFAIDEGMVAADARA